jgi:hypothetical protein
VKESKNIMIIDEKSIKKRGKIPPNFECIIKNVLMHAKKFSQDNAAIYVFYRESVNENECGWIICDNYDRGIFKPIFLSTQSNKFYTIREYSLHEYKDQLVGPYKHSEQFFFKDIDLLYT